ncbi:tail fiber protein [Mangrovibacter sp. SLW1]
MNALQKGNNLSELTDKSTARTSLGLGNAATYSVTATNKDTTPYRLMRVGDFGLGGSAVSVSVTDTDIANYPAPDFSAVRRYAASSGAHKTGLSAYGFNSGAVGYFAELVMPLTGTEKAAVRNSDGVQYLYSDKNKPSAAEVDAVSAAQGGTFQKKVTFNGGLQVRSETGVYAGGDAASFSDANMLFKSWYGIGFYCTLTGSEGIKAFINTRTGEIQAKGQMIPGSYANFDARYGVVNGVRRGGQQIYNGGYTWIGDWESPAGCVVTGFKVASASDGRKMAIIYRQLQYYNRQSNAWVNVGD